MPLMIKRHRLDRSERRPLIGGVDSDTLKDCNAMKSEESFVFGSTGNG